MYTDCTLCYNNILQKVNMRSQIKHFDECKGEKGLKFVRRKLIPLKQRRKMVIYEVISESSTSSFFLTSVVRRYDEDDEEEDEV